MKTKENFGILFFLLISSFFIYEIKCFASYRYGQSQYHKIRHQRQALKNLGYPLRQSFFTPKCIQKFWDIPNRDDCPNKHCTTNQDCWEPYGATKLCVCDPHLCGLVCMEDYRQCPTPSQPINGYANYSSLAVGDQVEYTCRPGYAVKGPRKRYCQANLRFSGHEPECTDQTDLCFSAPYIPNTQVADGSNRDDYKNKEDVKIICQKGFEDKSKSSIIATCSGNEWKYDPIKCEKKNCGKLIDPINGRTMYNNNYTFQSVAIQFCNDGFKIKCSTDQAEEKNCKRICEADGKWSGMTAICSPILCPELAAPENGEIIGHWKTVNSIKTFKCNEGYQLVGSHLRKCTHEGNWDGSNSSCHVRDCGPPPQIHFADVTFKFTTHGAKAEYDCKWSSTLVGHSTLTCGEVDGKSAWLPKPEPQCLLHCPPFIIDNAKVYANDSVQMKDIILHEKVPHGTNVTVKCQTGFELNRNIMPECNNGSWTYKPECTEASCPNRPPSMKYSTIRFYSLKHNSTARYYCHSGYRILYKNKGMTNLVTSFDIYCIQGKWSQMPPEGCQPIKCNKPKTPANGEIYLQGQSDRTHLIDDLIKPAHNRIVKYECHPDYRLKGPKIAVCLNGQWSPPESPTCEFIMHDELPFSWLYYQWDDTK